MQINFSPKAPDIYQVTKSPTNKYDTISAAIGLGITGLMVLGFFGLAFYAIHENNK
jgi:purine-cytosine permease-like protein